MRKLLLIYFPIILSIAACQKNETTKMSREIDSLKAVINSGGEIMSTMAIVNSLLDSIDATRHTMKIHHANGNEKEHYDSRMLELKDYVQLTENKIGELEAGMVETNVNSESYLTIISALKDELRMRNEELGLIDDDSELNNDVLLRNVQLEDIESRLEVKRIELMLLELRIAELVRLMNISEAEGFYLQGSAMEEATKRTKMAPFKRRQALRQALEYYEKALAKGKGEAKEKIESVKAKLDPYDN